MYIVIIFLLCMVIMYLLALNKANEPIQTEDPSVQEVNSQLHEQIGSLTERLHRLTEEHFILKEQHSDLSDKQRETVHTLGSERVRLGQVAENLAPFLVNFKYNPKHARVLLNPIDYVIFTEDEIVFLEVKSGNAKLSEKQRAIKKVIEAGKVRFEVMRINKEEGNAE